MFDVEVIIMVRKQGSHFQEARMIQVISLAARDLPDKAKVETLATDLGNRIINGPGRGIFRRE